MWHWWRTRRLVAWVGLLHYGLLISAIDLDLSNTDSIKKAARITADGMMSWYVGNQTGQWLGILPDPYYWWEAGAMWGQMIEYWFYTGDDTYNDVVTEGLLAQTGPEHDFMPENQTKTEGNDDQAFWAFAAMSAAEMKFPDPPPKKPSWLSLAQATFNLQVNRWDTEHCGGGLRWQIFAFNKGYDYKNSISNGGLFQLSARLARYTGNKTYSDWADKTWDWMADSVLMTDKYAVFDGAQIFNPPNCTEASPIQWTYNVGTMLMGAANMWNHTDGKEQKWKTRVLGLLDAAEAFFPKEFGSKIMVEVACEPQVTCNNDQPSFKAYLSRWMAATVQLCPFTEDRIMTKLRASAMGAAGQCTGAARGEHTCGRKWTQDKWDTKFGPGEQMSALSVIQANLIQKVRPPVTQQKGGTSKSDPTAGTKGDDPTGGLDPILTKPVTTADKAGAGILTALVVSMLIGTVYWICF